MGFRTGSVLESPLEALMRSKQADEHMCDIVSRAHALGLDIESGPSGIKSMAWHEEYGVGM